MGAGQLSSWRSGCVGSRCRWVGAHSTRGGASLCGYGCRGAGRDPGGRYLRGSASLVRSWVGGCRSTCCSGFSDGGGCWRGACMVAAGDSAVHFLDIEAIGTTAPWQGAGRRHASPLAAACLGTVAGTLRVGHVGLACWRAGGGEGVGLSHREVEHIPPEAQASPPHYTVLRGSPLWLGRGALRSGLFGRFWLCWGSRLRPPRAVALRGFTVCAGLLWLASGLV